MKNLITAGLLTLSLLACKDREPNPDVLPAATQTGANTGGALVDGKVWVAKVENIGPYTGGLANLYNAVNGKYTANIYLRSIDGASSIRIDLISNQDFTLKSYPLVYSNCNGHYYNTTNSKFYDTDDENIGVITFNRFDKVNQIFSGTFSFKAKDSNGNVVNITDGRFDKKFTN